MSSFPYCKKWCCIFLCLSHSVYAIIVTDSFCGNHCNIIILSVHLLRKKKKPMEKDQSHILRRLFFSTLYLSAFTFGGGYVIITLLKQKFVDELHWIDEEEMLDMVAIAQSSPGPIAVNGAIVIGYKLAGVPGILVSVLGAVIPPFVTLTVISFFYSAFKTNYYIQHLLSGMTAGVSAVIISVVWDMMNGVRRNKDALLMAVMVIAFVANYFLKINAVYIILATAAFGAVRTYINAKKHPREGGAP